MLKIGEFSKIAQVSVKALRYYDQLGLLKPAHIDRFTGYRYYTLTQLPELNHILLLKDLDFTLEQILSLRKLALTSEVLHQMLNNKANELRERLSSDRARLCRLENHLDQLERSANATYPPVVLKTAPDYLIATVRETLPTINLLSAWQENQLSVIHRFLKFNGLQQAGPDLLIYHQDDFREVDVDVEVGAIIRETSSSYADNLSDEPIRVHVLPGAAQIAMTVLTQMPGTASEIYASLTQWTQANGFRPIGPWRELTYEQYSPEAINLFEVQRPVKHADQFYSQLEERPMEPKIMTKPGFTMMGLRYFGKNEKGEVSDLWQAFNQQVAALGGYLTRRVKQRSVCASHRKMLRQRGPLNTLPVFRSAKWGISLRALLCGRCLNTLMRFLPTKVTWRASKKPMNTSMKSGCRSPIMCWLRRWTWSTTTRTSNSLHLIRFCIFLSLLRKHSAEM